MSSSAIVLGCHPHKCVRAVDSLERNSLLGSDCFNTTSVLFLKTSRIVGHSNTKLYTPTFLFILKSHALLPLQSSHMIAKMRCCSVSLSRQLSPLIYKRLPLVVGCDGEQRPPGSKLMSVRWTGRRLMSIRVTYVEDLTAFDTVELAPSGPNHTCSMTRMIGPESGRFTRDVQESAQTGAPCP